MDAIGEQVGESGIDRTLAGDAILALECGTDDFYREMRFATRIMAGVARMVMAVIDHGEMRRGECFGKSAGDFGRNRACRFVGHRPYIGSMHGDGQSNRRKGERFHGRVAGSAEQCARGGCDQPGEFRAPLARGEAGWQFLCLDHVREFNDSYNYFAGMSTEEIEQAQRPFAGWERETRAFAAAANAGFGPRWSDFRDPLDAMGEHFSSRAPRADGRQLSDNDHRLLKVMGLEADADRRTLRRRYAELLRRYHPDHNGGDRSHEKRLQDVIAAYTTLKGRPAFA